MENLGGSYSIRNTASVRSLIFVGPISFFFVMVIWPMLQNWTIQESYKARSFEQRTFTGVAHFGSMNVVVMLQSA